jgi:hypothetical protein
MKTLLDTMLRTAGVLALALLCVVLIDMHFLVRTSTFAILDLQDTLSDASGTLTSAKATISRLDGTVSHADAFLKAAQPLFQAETKRIQASTQELQKTEASARLLIVRTDESLNGKAGMQGLIPQATAALQQITADTKQLEPSLENFSRGTQGLANAANDPSIQASLKSLATVTEQTAGVATDAHAETSLILGQTRKAFEPESRVKTILKMLFNGTLNGAELFYYLSH